MQINRRHFLRETTALASAAGLSTSAGTAGAAASGGFADLRKDFHLREGQTYLNSARHYPLNVHSVRAIEAYVDHMKQDPADESERRRLHEVKTKFANLINAKPNEICFTPGTMAGEMILMDGLRLENTGYNVVTNDLSYSASLYNYSKRAQHGLDLRIVKHGDWQTDLGAVERAVDDKTRLLSVAMVSNMNGYVEDVKALSDVVHARGGYLYTDIIQCAGSVPIDVRAMGIDFAACSMYKFLMGVHGFGFLYIREDLQGSVIKSTEMHGGVSLNYRPWVGEPDPSKDEIIIGEREGAARFEVGAPPFVSYAAAEASLELIESLGVERIQAHAVKLIRRLRKGMAEIGFPAVTPDENGSSIISFRVNDPQVAQSKLEAADVVVTMIPAYKLMRVSMSVFTTNEDLDRLLEAVS